MMKYDGQWNLTPGIIALKGTKNSIEQHYVVRRHENGSGILLELHNSTTDSSALIT